MVLRRFWLLLQRSLLSRGRHDRDLDDELRFHLTEEAQLRRDRGASAEDAERAARLALGSVTGTKEATRAVWVSARLEQLLQDLRAGGRIVTRSPGLTAAAVALVALVVGGNATIFSVIHGILGKPAPGVEAANLVTLTWTTPNWIEPETSYANYTDLVSQVGSMRIAGAQPDRMTLSDDNGSHAVWGSPVTPHYFDVLGVRLARGRSLDAVGGGGAGLTAVISDAAWRTYFNSAADIVGTPFLLNGLPATVVGVAASPFRGSMLAPPVDLWVPFAEFARAVNRGEMLLARDGRGPILTGRLRDGQSIDTARAELTSVWTRMKAAYPELRQDMDVVVLPYTAVAGGNGLASTDGDTFLAIFSVLTAITLFLVCANVANLLIGRAITRQREMALRQSLGASRGRIIRLLLGEGLAISTLAWASACVFAWWVAKAIPPLIAPDEEYARHLDVAPDWTVAAYALVLALAAMMAFTVAPALRAWRQPLLPWLKAGEQGIVAGRSRLSSGLVVLQLAFSVLLLVTAGLASRSASLLANTDLGYDAHRLLLATVRTTGAVDDPAARTALFARLRDRLQAMPGIAAVSYASGRPREFRATSPIRAEGAQAPVLSEVNRVGPGYLAAFGLSPSAGVDVPQPIPARTGAPAVVTESLARSLWPGQSPLGRTFVVEQSTIVAEVVGVSPDAYFSGQRGTEPRIALIAAADVSNAGGEATFYVRYSGSLETAVADIRRAIRVEDARVPVVSMLTMDAQLRAILSPILLVTSLLTVFGGASLLIAAIGLYAAVSFDMRRRVREVGVRMALGASTAQVLASVLGDGLKATAVGLGVGFLLSAGMATALSGALYGVTPTDAVTYLSVFSLLALASMVACFLPARRAARIDPIKALRYE